MQQVTTRQLGRDGRPVPFKPEDLAVVPLLGPKGEIAHHRPRANGGGASPCKWDAEDEELKIPKKYRAQGWCFYKDVCEGNYTPKQGGEPVAMPEKFEAWRAAHDEISEGWEGAPTGPDFYHPEVYARRGLRKGMNEAKPDSVFDHAQREANAAQTEDSKAKANRRGKGKRSDGKA